MNAEDSERLRQVHLAVIGDEKARIPGLAKRVEDLEKHRVSLDLRIAGVSGGAFVLCALGKWLFGFLSK